MVRSACLIRANNKFLRRERNVASYPRRIEAPRRIKTRSEPSASIDQRDERCLVRMWNLRSNESRENFVDPVTSIDREREGERERERLLIKRSAGNWPGSSDRLRIWIFFLRSKLSDDWLRDKYRRRELRVFGD